MLYESTVCADGMAYAITSVAGMGDIHMPRSHQQALESKESTYWQEAIAKELNGLVEIGTFEFVRVVDLPKHANIMRCHFVFTVKRHADGSIEKFKARFWWQTEIRSAGASILIEYSPRSSQNYLR